MKTIHPRIYEAKLGVFVDDRPYSVEVHHWYRAPPKSTKIIIPSYQTNDGTRKYMEPCLRSLMAYTNQDQFEIWIVESGDRKHLDWLPDLPNAGARLNIIYRHDRHVDAGSYDCAVNLEIARQIIHPQTEKMIYLHNDTLLTQKGGVESVINLFDEDTAIVGLKKTVKFGFEVPVNYFIAYNFQILQKNNISLLPVGPEYDFEHLANWTLDTGELAAILLQNAGFTVKYAKNGNFWLKHIERGWEKSKRGD